MQSKELGQFRGHRLELVVPHDAVAGMRLRPVDHGLDLPEREVAVESEIVPYVGADGRGQIGSARTSLTARPNGSLKSAMAFPILRIVSFAIVMEFLCRTWRASPSINLPGRCLPCFRQRYRIGSACIQASLRGGIR